QRLGVISLHYDVNETIELFDWCAISVDALTQSQESATESATKLKSIEASLKDLQSQLEELVQAKQEDELALLHNFRNLLNEKKVKIRQQQILITELSANAIKTPQEQKLADERPEAKWSKKRATKRKAKAVEPEESDKDLPTTIKSEPEHSDADNTTEATASVPSDDHDDDDDDGDHDDHDKGPQSSGQVPSETEAPRKTAAAPPPPRTLPFQRRKPVTTTNYTDDTDSDDEL
ncbi:hypothetical protein E4U53_001026, partial [Claviceps sorghi]